MIFVTLGTHEQPFSRLVDELNRLKKVGEITDDIIIQSGYTDVDSEHLHSKTFMSFDEMTINMNEARIVVTHGGPSTFLEAQSLGKQPIVVPRLEKFNEHVNDHQLDFLKLLESKGRNLNYVEDITDLGNVLAEYDNHHINQPVEKNYIQFLTKFERLLEKL